MALKDHMVNMYQKGKVRSKGRKKASKAMGAIKPKGGGY